MSNIVLARQMQAIVRSEPDSMDKWGLSVTDALESFILIDFSVVPAGNGEIQSALLAPLRYCSKRYW